MDIHTKLQQMLAHYEWTTYKLAKESGLAESTLSKILTQKAIPSIPTLEAICKAFGITLSQFFAEDEMVELNKEQQELFEKWITLTPRQKSAVYHIIDTFQAKE